MQDVIERSLDLPHPPSRIWRALTDHERFGAWFGVAMDGPFRLGQPVGGQFTLEGHTHSRFEAEVVEWTPETVFAWRWRPHGIAEGEPMTLVRFTLAPTPAGARLTVVESGFAGLPITKAQEALRGNTNGWEFQFGRFQAFLAAEAAKTGARADA